MPEQLLSGPTLNRYIMAWAINQQLVLECILCCIDVIHAPYNVSGYNVVWPFRFVAVSVCGRSGLWPFRFVAVPGYGRFGLWPFRSVAPSVCDRFGLWPFRFVAVSVVAVSVCGRCDLLPSHAG